MGPGGVKAAAAKRPSTDATSGDENRAPLSKASTLPAPVTAPGTPGSKRLRPSM